MAQDAFTRAPSDGVRKGKREIPALPCSILLPSLPSSLTCLLPTSASLFISMLPAFSPLNSAYSLLLNPASLHSSLPSLLPLVSHPLPLLTYSLHFCFLSNLPSSPPCLLPPFSMLVPRHDWLSCRRNTSGHAGMAGS
eukprot:767444-Hanusia_phi.AAC.11